MINYKSFKISTNAKLRVRSDQIVATVSSKDNNVTEIYVAGMAFPWRVISDDSSRVIDYIWERHEKEEEND